MYFNTNKPLKSLTLSPNNRYNEGMKDCLFCKMISGEIPVAKIYEDENIFAFLDINPVNIGHTLVIPKKHSRNILDIEKVDLNNVMAGVQNISKRVKRAVGAEGINVMNNNEPSAGQVIFHTHFHVVPRFTDDGFKQWEGKRPYKDGEAEEIAEKIKNNI